MVPAVGDGLEVLEQQAVHGLRPIGRQRPAEGAVERADGGAGVDDEHAGTLGVHVLVGHGRRIGGEFADDLLQQVLERHQALDVAVLVDDECQAAPVALEVGQLHVERGALGHEVRFAAARQLDQPLARQRAAHQFVGHALHVQQADEVVELAVVHRQSRVRRLASWSRMSSQLSPHVDAGDLLARDHDVVHRHAPEVEDRQQHLAVARRDHRRGLGHHRAQLLGAERLGAARPRAPRRTAAGSRRRGCW